MKIRMIALAGVAALALSGPALAGEATGWYVDLSGGYDHMGQFTSHDISSAQEVKVETDNGGLITGAWGYKFHDHIRVEGEFGYLHYTTDTIAPLSRAMQSAAARLSEGLRLLRLG